MRSLLRDRKVPAVEVVVHVSALQVFEDDEEVLVVFEVVQQLDEVLVLAHLQRLDLPALQLQFLFGTVGFLDDFGSALLACPFVSDQLDFSHGAFANVAHDVVELVEVLRLGHFAHALQPAVLNRFFKEVKAP